MQIQAITLIVDDLESSRAFYETVVDLPVHFSDDESVVFDFHGVLVNLLAAPAAPELIDPVPLAPAAAGVRMQVTVPVDDVDVAAAGIASLGIDLVRGPETRSWGVRTASFRDPSGHLWELAH